MTRINFLELVLGAMPCTLGTPLVAALCERRAQEARP